MKVKKETYISFIIDELKKGKTDAIDICSAFCSKFQCSDRTFYNYWENAKEQYRTLQESIELEKTKEYTAQQLEAHRSGIIDKNEALKILSNIAKGNASQVKLKVGDKEKVETIIPTTNDRKSAIEVISKIEGWFAPSKVEQKNSFEDLKIKGIIIE